MGGQHIASLFFNSQFIMTYRLYQIMHCYVHKLVSDVDLLSMSQKPDFSKEIVDSAPSAYLRDEAVLESWWVRVRTQSYVIRDSRVCLKAR